MKTNLKILHLEDVATDAELVERELKKGKIQFEILIVGNKIAFEKGLIEFAPEIIIADHTLPSFDSFEAIRIMKQKEIKIPIILVTATVSGEYAVEIMKAGAYDYILKDRLHRLPQAVLNAIETCRLKRAKEAVIDDLIKSQVHLKEAQEIAKLGSWEMNLQTFNIIWSEETHRIFGTDPKTFQVTYEGYFYFTHPDDRKKVNTILENLFTSQSNTSLEYRIISTNGTLKHVRVNGRTFQDEKGHTARSLGTIQDITDQKEQKLQKEKMMEDIVRRNRNLEQFSYIISHDLRLPVANILGFMDILQANDITTETMAGIKEGLSTSAKKMDKVISDLNGILKLKQNTKEKKELVDFSHLTTNVYQSIEATIVKERATINWDFSEVTEVKTIKSYLNSIFYNLITNSLKYRQPGIPVKIEIKSEKIDNKVILTFGDNGLGIDLEKNGDQVFQLYKRFHPDRAEGEGMGLYMVKTQVEIIGGSISIKSEVNKGTEIRIEFSM